LAGTNESNLVDLTVVSLSQLLAGPYASMQLADLGADVIKIERVGRGDVARTVYSDSSYFELVNRNKKSIGLNLKQESGQSVAKDLLEEADVFIENTKPGRVEKFDLDYETVNTINDEIIYCSIKGFGSDSPYENLPATDYVVQAMCGMMSMTGTTDSDPAWLGLPVGDLIASMYAVQGILAVLASEAHADRSEYIEVPMLDAAISWLTSRAAYTFSENKPFPRGVHPGIEPQAVFKTKDEEVAVAVGTDGLWPGFCEAIDRPDLREDERFQSQDDRVEHRDALRTEVESELKQKTAQEWFNIFHEQSVPVVPIYDTQTVWDDAHVRQRGLLQEIERSDGSTGYVIDNPL